MTTGAPEERMVPLHFGLDESLRRVRELVLAFGWNATSYQIVNPGMRYWFASEADAVIGYVEHQKVRVVAGAPVCALERLPAVIAEFEADAARDGAGVCYFGAEARLAGLLRDSPRHSRMLLGAQPVWNPASWAQIFAHHASLRAQLNRARNKGVGVAEWPVARATGHPALHRCLAEWLAVRGLPPMHFLIEPETLARLEDRRVFVAERGGEVCGFLIASPVARRSGWLIEQIVRGAGAVNGVAELLVDTAARAVAADGSEYMTLGLSPLSQRGAHAEDEHPLWLQTLLTLVRAHGRRFYNFEGLDAFKAKFEPERWDPVYAIANEPRFSPLMLFAIAAAFTEGSPIGTVLSALARAARQEINWMADALRSAKR